MSRPHALVAGGNGFIGRSLALHLLRKGYRVTCLDCFITSREGAGQKWILENGKNEISPADLQFLNADIVELEEKKTLLEQAFARFGKPTEIYNLASPASPVDFARLPDFILQTAAVGHRNLLALARDVGARILFASSSEVYGDALVHPQPETYFGNVNPFGPRSCYDEAKRFGEALSYSWNKQFQVAVRIARIFNTYGPGMRLDDGRVIPNFFVQALQGESLTINGNGEQTRSFCYVADLVDGLFRLMQSSETTPLNLGSTFEYTVLNVAEKINSLVGNQAPIRNLRLPENDPKLRRPDLTKTQAALGWQPKTDFEQGLRLSFEYFQKETQLSPRRIDTPTMHS